MANKPETVICKVCGNEIPKKAKICPKCGVKQRKHTVLGIVLVVLGIILVIAAIGGGGSDDEPKKTSDTKTQQSQSTQKEEPKQETKKESEKTTFGVGEEASLNDIIVTLVDISESTGANYMEPTSGNVFLLCEFEIENASNKEINISSMLCFDAYVDDYSTSLSLTAEMASDKGQLDGTVAAGKKMNGVIGYEVAEDWEEIEIHFTPDFWSGKEFIFVANK